MSDSKLKIYFGNRQEAQDTTNMSFQSQEQPFDIPILKKLQKDWGIKNFISLKQTHSDIGHIVTDNNLSNYISNLNEGDYLITNLHNTALGVYTADCLAIIFYDYLNQAIGIAHAGWRGSVNQIAIKTFLAMQKKFKTSAQECVVFFSPNAKVCCYNVSIDFKQNLEKFSIIDKVLFEKNNKLYFDSSLFNKLQLLSIGIKEENINLENNICTICNPEFCSFRREKNQYRQLTIVSL